MNMIEKEEFISILNKASRNDLLQAIDDLAKRDSNTLNELYNLTGYYTRTESPEPVVLKKYSDIPTFLKQLHEDKFHLIFYENSHAVIPTVPHYSITEGVSVPGVLVDPSNALLHLMKIPSLLAAAKPSQAITEMIGQLLDLTVWCQYSANGQSRKASVTFKFLCIMMNTRKIYMETVLLKSFFLYMTSMKDFRTYVRESESVLSSAFAGFEKPFRVLPDPSSHSFQEYLQALFIEVCSNQKAGNLLAAHAAPLLKRDSVRHLRNSKIASFAKSNKDIRSAYVRGI